MTPQSFAPGALPPTVPRDSRGFCRRGCCWNPHGICGRDRACMCHIWDDE